jgi:hypothetical protein
MRNITKDNFESWLHSDVTLRFFAEMTEDLEYFKNQRITGDNEQIIRLVHERNQGMDIIENVLTWKPAELIEESK